ncbi:MAG: MFS transporter, partial [Lentisphaeria bacterium]|nr:MFS transporter [Lentisphaeria bacterium]
AYAWFTPLWGMLGDRVGVKLMLYRGSFLTAFIYPLLGMVSDVHWLIFLRFVTGALSGTTIAAQMLLVKTIPNQRQGYALGVLGTAIWGGAMIGEVLGGLAVYRYGYMVTFTLCGVLFFVSGLCVVLARDSEKAAAPGPRRRLFTGDGVRWMFVPPIVLMLILFLLCGIAQRFYMPYTALMVERLVASTREAAKWLGIIGAFAAAGGMISGVVLGALSDRFPEWKLTTPMQFLSAAMLFLAAGATSLFGFGFCHAANGFALGGLYSVYQKVISGLVERTKRGTVLGWATTMFNAGYMLAAVISGLVVKAHGLPAVYRTDAVLMVVLAVSSLLIVRMATRHRDRLRIAAGGGENGIPQPTSGGRDK